MAVIEAWIGNYVTQDYVQAQDDYVLGPITARAAMAVAGEIVTYVNATVGMYSAFSMDGVVGVVEQHASASWQTEFSITVSSGITLEAAGTFASSFNQTTTADVSIFAAITVNVATAVALNAQNLIAAIISIDDVFLMQIHARATLRGDIDMDSDTSITIAASILHSTATVDISVAFTTTIVPDLFVGGTATFSSQFTQTLSSSVAVDAAATMPVICSMVTDAVVYLFIEGSATMVSSFSQNTVGANFITLAGEYADYTWDSVVTWDTWPYEIWGPVGSLWMPTQTTFTGTPRLILTGRVISNNSFSMTVIPLLIHGGTVNAFSEFTMSATGSYLLLAEISMAANTTCSITGTVTQNATATWNTVFSAAITGIKVVFATVDMPVITTMVATADVTMTPSVDMPVVFTMSTTATKIHFGIVNCDSEFSMITNAAVAVDSGAVAITSNFDMQTVAGIVFDISVNIASEFTTTVNAQVLTGVVVFMNAEFFQTTVAEIDIQASGTWTAFFIQVTIGKELQPTAYRTVDVNSETRIAVIYQENRQLQISSETRTLFLPTYNASIRRVA